MNKGKKGIMGRGGIELIIGNHNPTLYFSHIVNISDAIIVNSITIKNEKRRLWLPFSVLKNNQLSYL